MAKAGIEWHKNALPKTTQTALDFFSKAVWLKTSSWYLAGGTALTLQVGHRQSVDLDFFCPNKHVRLQQLLSRLEETHWRTDRVEEDTIHGRLFGARVSFIANPSFFPRAKPHWYGCVRVLDKKDIAVMKVIAISQRGYKRDFMDLFWYVRDSEPLLKVLNRLTDQYPSVAHDLHHILKSLVYFKDADEDPDPIFLENVSWRATKTFFQREVPKLTQQLLGLK
ncbi:hypothetical protein EPN81_03380 [Patescibacteria group bacterium]|nr:MAG: hypothetical protein EPN81_03380 [Patescibacteria group bacterium]